MTKVRAYAAITSSILRAMTNEKGQDRRDYHLQ